MGGKKINIECIRVFAIFLTIMVHISNLYIMRCPSLEGWKFFSAVTYNSIARVCVPLFFMISGIFLLKGEFVRAKYIARIRRFVLILAAWSIVYYLYNYGFTLKNAGKIFVQSIFNPSMTSRHLWFMYAIIGIYIALPFIQNMCKNMTREQENMFLILWVVLSGLDSVYVPLASRYVGMDLTVSYPVPIINATYYLGYFVVGHILYERFRRTKRVRRVNAICVLGYVVSTILSVVITYFVSKHDHQYFDAMTWYRGILVIVASVSLFALMVVHEEQIKHSAILKLSELSFGVYLIHYIFVSEIVERWEVVELNPILFIPLITLGVYVASLTVCWVLKRIPVLKWMI